MTFNALQEATEIIGETELYEFNFGEFIERYTSSRKLISYLGNDYFPLSIRREGPSQDQEVTSTRVRLTFPIRPTFTQMVAEGAVRPISLKIVRGFGSNYLTDYQDPWFVGQVTELFPGRTVTKITVESVTRLLEANLPAVVVSAECNNMLFDPTCALLESDFTIFPTVTAISLSGRTITTSTLFKKDGITVAPAQWYQRGKCSKSGTGMYREVLDHPNSTTLVLAVPIQGLAIGDTLRLSAGCDKKEATCAGIKFNNKVNFIGMPEVPAQDPVTVGF